jgi:hypothetical protein
VLFVTLTRDKIREVNQGERRNRRGRRGAGKKEDQIVEVIVCLVGNSGTSRGLKAGSFPSSICSPSRVRLLVPHRHLPAAGTFRDVRRHIPAEARDTDR